MRIALLLLVVSPVNYYAQVSSLPEIENQLKVTGDSLLKGSHDSVRASAAARFDSLLTIALNSDIAFHHPFESVTNLSVLTSSDNRVRLYTYIRPLTDASGFHYFGFIQWKEKKDSPCRLFRLNEKRIERNAAEKMICGINDWPGALYYKIITTSANKKKYYTLLGWKGNTTETTMKVIDVLTFDKGKPLFGSPVFHTEAGMRMRIVFEYNARASMSLNYDRKTRRIVFDHLSPPSPLLTGNFSTYGPDFTYDALKWSKGKWMLLKNVELRNPSAFDPKPTEKKPAQKKFYQPE